MSPRGVKFAATTHTRLFDTTARDSITNDTRSSYRYTDAETGYSTKSRASSKPSRASSEPSQSMSKMSRSDAVKVLLEIFSQSCTMAGQAGMTDIEVQDIWSRAKASSCYASSPPADNTSTSRASSKYRPSSNTGTPRVSSNYRPPQVSSGDTADSSLASTYRNTASSTSQTSPSTSTPTRSYVGISRNGESHEGWASRRRDRGSSSGGEYTDDVYMNENQRAEREIARAEALADSEREASRWGLSTYAKLGMAAGAAGLIGTGVYLACTNPSSLHPSSMWNGIKSAGSALTGSGVAQTVTGGVSSLWNGVRNIGTASPVLTGIATGVAKNIAMAKATDYAMALTGGTSSAPASTNFGSMMASSNLRGRHISNLPSVSAQSVATRPRGRFASDSRPRDSSGELLTTHRSSVAPQPAKSARTWGSTLGWTAAGTAAVGLLGAGLTSYYAPESVVGSLGNAAISGAGTAASAAASCISKWGGSLFGASTAALPVVADVIVPELTAADWRRKLGRR